MLGWKINLSDEHKGIFTRLRRRGLNSSGLHRFLSKARYFRVKCRMTPIFVTRLLTQRELSRVSIPSDGFTLVTSAIIRPGRGIPRLFRRCAYYSFRVISPRQWRRDASRLKSRGRSSAIAETRCCAIGASRPRPRISDAREGANDSVARCNEKRVHSCSAHSRKQGRA